jgi:hypothetical protein
MGTGRLGEEKNLTANKQIILIDPLLMRDL